MKFVNGEAFVGYSKIICIMYEAGERIPIVYFVISTCSTSMRLCTPKKQGSK